MRMTEQVESGVNMEKKHGETSVMMCIPTGSWVNIRKKEREKCV